jgi:hypothetical protein
MSVGKSFFTSASDSVIGSEIGRADTNSTATCSVPRCPARFTDAAFLGSCTLSAFGIAPAPTVAT